MIHLFLLQFDVRVGLVKDSVCVRSLLGGDSKVHGPGLQPLDVVVLVHRTQAGTGQAH